MNATSLDNPTHITGNVNLDDPDSHQLVYASQLYGTFFAVSAKLHIEQKKLCSMDLTLINYKGLYNIGMLDSTRTAWKVKDKTAVLVLHLIACGGLHGHGRTLKLNCNKEKFQDLDYLIVTRKLHSFVKETGSSQIDHLYDNYFDSEFYERDGAVIRPISRLDDVILKDKNGKTKPMTDEHGKCQTARSRFLKK